MTALADGFMRQAAYPTETLWNEKEERASHSCFPLCPPAVHCFRTGQMKSASSQTSLLEDCLECLPLALWGMLPTPQGSLQLCLIIKLLPNGQDLTHDRAIKCGTPGWPCCLSDKGDGGTCQHRQRALGLTPPPCLLPTPAGLGFQHVGRPVLQNTKPMFCNDEDSMFKKGWEISPLLGIQNTHEHSHGCEEASTKENLLAFPRDTLLKLVTAVRETCGLLGGVEQPSHTLCTYTSSGDLVQGQILTPQASAEAPDAVSLTSPRRTVMLQVHRPQGSRVAAEEKTEHKEVKPCLWSPLSGEAEI
ncbi:uncharacterized protein LOC129394520 [Pan paniscus]|uniref:uncharacterized protein LOC129394520 n=1 Tax=Pan paniscus TaxID=9597 RepID=UPI0004F02E14|nr:uncharacterized protein LOC129394520 [Pan paniscus]